MRLGGIKIIVDGQVYRCTTFKLNYGKNNITIYNPDDRQVKHDVRDWNSFNSHAVLVQDVDKHMAEAALTKTPKPRKENRQQQVRQSEFVDEERVMSNFAGIKESDDGTIHICVYDVKLANGKDLEDMLDIIGIDPRSSIVIEKYNEEEEEEGQDDDDDDEIEEGDDDEQEYIDDDDDIEEEE